MSHFFQQKLGGAKSKHLGHRPALELLEVGALALANQRPMGYQRNTNPGTQPARWSWVVSYINGFIHQPWFSFTFLPSSSFYPLLNLLVCRSNDTSYILSLSCPRECACFKKMFSKSCFHAVGSCKKNGLISFGPSKNISNLFWSHHFFIFVFSFKKISQISSGVTISSFLFFLS